MSHTSTSKNLHSISVIAKQTKLPVFTTVPRAIINCLMIVLLCAFSVSSSAQCRLLNETFGVNPALSSTNVDGAWYPDRYEPAGFVADAGRLKISISAADGAQLRSGGFGSTFYNTQGRKFNQCGGCVTVLKGDLYIPADWVN